MDLISLSKELFSQKLIARPRYYQELDATIKAHQITIIQGQRRVGKSSLVLGYLQNLPLNPKTIFFLNKELDSEGKIASAKELNQLFEAYVEENGQPEYIFIDEIQDIKNWENFVRARFALKKEKIIISGSNSQLLSGELATYLTGRYLTFDVFPLGFDEFILFKGKGEKTELLQEYLRRWGMPELTKIDTDAQKMSYLQTMFQTIIYKDIVKRYTIKDIAYLEKLMQYLADIVGSPVSLRNIVDASVQAGWGDPSLATISNYLHYLQQPYLVHKVRRFDIKGKKILEHNEKYYFNDIGMRNFFKVDMQRDIGKLVENIVYLHLRKCGYTVYVGMIDGKEIDFIAEKGKKRCYIQATYMMPNSWTIEREFGNLELINDHYPKYVVSLDPIATGERKGIQWNYLPNFIETFT